MAQEKRRIETRQELLEPTEPHHKSQVQKLESENSHMETDVLKNLLADPLLSATTHPQLKNLTIANYNVNGMRKQKKINCVHNLFSTLKPDVLVLTETHDNRKLNFNQEKISWMSTNHLL